MINVFVDGSLIAGSLSLMMEVGMGSSLSMCLECFRHLEEKSWKQGFYIGVKPSRGTAGDFLCSHLPTFVFVVISEMLRTISILMTILFGSQTKEAKADSDVQM